MGTLCLVATPIGNLGDITLRALEALRSADAIACEDTRHTLKLLSHFEIRKTLLSCHANDEERGAKRVIALLDEGKTVAYCSDAGTPGLSDPGSLLARRAREAGHQVMPPSRPLCIRRLDQRRGNGRQVLPFRRLSLAQGGQTPIQSGRAHGSRGVLRPLRVALSRHRPNGRNRRGRSRPAEYA